MSHPREKEIVAMLRDGMAGRRVAEALKLDRRTVYTIRDAHGIPKWAATVDATECRHGHAWPQHLAAYPNGTHYCRECRRLRKRQERAAAGVGNVDQLAVELAVAGQPTRLTSSERRAAVRELLNRSHTRDLSGKQMAKRLGCTDRTVWRIRKELREAA